MALCLKYECRPNVRAVLHVVLHVGQGVELRLVRLVGVVRVHQLDPKGDYIEG